MQITSEFLWSIEKGKGRLYPAYSLSGSEGEDSPKRYKSSHNTYQHPLYQQPSGLSDTPTSENASDATLTDSELALARDSTLLVHNVNFKECSILRATPAVCEFPTIFTTFSGINTPHYRHRIICRSSVPFLRAETS
ncbi:unnamed protein product [Phyllotreta striolata]|uniref:Uncharacterized protein n=1 Tax=Phyllotreta striolata TaxID=444603 RepID=A0A9N9TMN7_PHYSR|nr:unnamed protein product [Phyllotreta striolata]